MSQWTLSGISHFLRGAEHQTGGEMGDNVKMQVNWKVCDRVGAFGSNKQVCSVVR